MSAAIIASLPIPPSPQLPLHPPENVEPKGSYIIKLKSDSDAKKLVEDIKKQGGEIEDDQSKSTFLPRITAKLPESFAKSLNDTLQGGKHDVIEYIEPNGEIKVSPLPGNLPNPPKRD